MLLLSLLSGCWSPFTSARFECEGSGVDAVSGEVLVGDEARNAAVAVVWMDAETSGECVLAVSMTLELGQGCSVALDADGAGEELVIYDLTLIGEEGCGLGGSGWSAEDLGDSTVWIDGALEESIIEGSHCYEGEVVVRLDAVVANNEESRSLTGELTIDGFYGTSSLAGSCD